MPASSFSVALNTGVYLLAMGLFLGLTLPMLDGVHKAAESQSLRAIAGGLQSEVNSLVPGMKTKFAFASPLAALTLSLHGRSIVASADGITIVESVKWRLPDAELLPGRGYTLSFTTNGVLLEESRGR